MSNDTRWPAARLRIPAASTAVAWTNTSLPPPSGAIKPKPFDVLKNFTVPTAIPSPVASDYARSTRTGATNGNYQLRKVGFFNQARTKRVGIRNGALQLTECRRGGVRSPHPSKCQPTFFCMRAAGAPALATAALFRSHARNPDAVAAQAAFDCH